MSNKHLVVSQFCQNLLYLSPSLLILWVVRARCCSSRLCVGLALVGPGLIEPGLGNKMSRKSISLCLYTAGMKIPIRSTWLFGWSRTTSAHTGTGNQARARTVTRRPLMSGRQRAKMWSAAPIYVDELGVSLFV